jgi:hypothetical protein
MTSPYLKQSFVPLGVALPQMLENIEAELAYEKLEPAHKSRLRHRRTNPLADRTAVLAVSAY